MNSQLVDEELASSIQSLGQAALHLHLQSGVELEMPAPDTWSSPDAAPKSGNHLVKVIRFDSLECRNAALAAHFHARLGGQGQVSAADLFGVAYDLWAREIGRPDTAAGRLLALFDATQDVFSLAEEHIGRGGNVFDVVQVVGTMLKYLEQLNLSSLISLAHAQFDLTKNDTMAGLLFEPLTQWLASRPEHARALTQAVVTSDHPAAEGLLNISIGAVFRSNPAEGLALALAEASDDRPTRKRGGSWLLGQFLLHQPSEKMRTDIEEKITEGLRSEDAEDWIAVAGDTLHATAAFDEQLMRLCKAEKESALTVVARALFLKGSDLATQGRVSMWLPSLVAYDAAVARSALDLALTGFLERSTETQPSIAEFLTAWATRHSGNSPIEKKLIEAFGQTVRKLASKPSRFETLITEWLIARDRRLAAAAAGILGEFEAEGVKSVHLNADVLSSLSKSATMFLARRLLGYVHSTSHVIAMSLSILQVSEEKLEHVLPVLRSVFEDELGYDYPGTVMEALDLASKTETRPSILLALDKWRGTIRSRLEAMERLPRRNELLPPSQLQRQFSLARARQMQKAGDQASEKSILSQIATRIPLKAGRGFFSHSHGKFGAANQLQTLSYSIELPRREVLDPIGNAIRGIRLRIAVEGHE